MHTKFLPYSTCICVPSLVLIAHVVVFLVQRGHTDTQTVTDVTIILSHVSATVLRLHNAVVNITIGTLKQILKRS